MAGPRAGAALQLVVAVATALAPMPIPDVEEEARRALVDELLAGADPGLLADGIRMCAGMYLAALAMNAHVCGRDPAHDQVAVLRVLGHTAAQLAARTEGAAP
jgi:hypothetical protein